ncbi:amidohydrolase [Leucobacter sp. USHLN153]|uniref:amidohydrolase n=1 Tax=Leucobacter sp. USHLN153 TaxID=3081268 RepID=UPI0030193D31
MTHATTGNAADLLIHSATVWTGEEGASASAIAIRDGRIVAVGGEELREQFAAVREIDAAGGLVTPGFVDAHVHAGIGGIELTRCELSEAADADETLALVAEYAAAHPEVEWIVGGGWHMPHYPGGTPRRELLDRVVPDRPVFLINADHHGAWANTRALELAGIDASTPDPVDGRIERDADGSPSGTLHEGAAELLDHVLPRTTSDEVRAGILAGQRRLFEYGIVGWQEAILGAYAGYPDFTPEYRALFDSGELVGRATGALWVARGFDGKSIPEFVDDLIERRARFGAEGFDLSTAKIMVDGVAENETAAMEDPYLDECSCARGTGLAYFSPEELNELVPLLNANGFNVHLHAIGDRAARIALDAVALVPARDRARVRNHIAHLQIVDPVDIPRFAELGVTANLQTLWAAIDPQMAELTLPLLGEKRAKWQYPFGSLLRAGAALACGSDWPVSTPDPWQAIHVAVNRREPEETELPALNSEEAVGLSVMLRAYTLGSHDLLGLPGGRIAVGEVADLAIADRDPFQGPSAEIYRTMNRVTIVAGRVVYNAE